MSMKKDLFIQLCEELKRMADSTNAGRAYVEFKREDGDIFRVEYKPSKKVVRNGTV